MPEITYEHRLDAIPEQHRRHAKSMMEAVHETTPEGPRQLWDVDSTEVDRSVHDISKFIELATNELGEDAGRGEIERHALEVATNYALAAQMWAENSPDSEEAQEDAEKAVESLLIWSTLTGSWRQPKTEGIEKLIEKGYGEQLMGATHRMAERGLVVAEDEGIGSKAFQPLAGSMRGYETALSIAYGKQLEPTASDEYFGKPLSAQDQEGLLSTLHPDDLKIAYVAAEGAKPGSEHAATLAEKYVMSLVDQSYTIEDDQGASEVLKGLGGQHPEVLEALAGSDFVLKALENRSVTTERIYMQNNPQALRLNFLVARLLADPATPEATREFALGMISDNPRQERDLLDWPLDFTKATDAQKEFVNRIVQERAEQNQIESERLMEESTVPEAVGQQLDLDADTIRKILDNYRGDRRVVLKSFESFGVERDLETLEKELLKDTLVDGKFDEKKWDGGLIRMKRFFDAQTVGKLSALFPTELPAGVEALTRTAPGRMEYSLDSFIETVQALSEDEFARRFAEGGDLYEQADAVYSYILRAETRYDSERRLIRTSSLGEAGLFEIQTPDGIAVAVNERLLTNLPDNAEEGVGELNQIVNSEFTAMLFKLSNPQDRKLIMDDVSAHYSSWQAALGGSLLRPLDTEVVEYIHKALERAGVPPSSAFEAMDMLRMDGDEYSYDQTILRSLIDRATIDKLPSNPTKLIDRIPDVRMRDLYTRIIGLKGENPAMSSEEIYAYLRANELMTDEEIQTLSGIDMTEKADLTRLLVDKKSYLESRAVRSRWLSGEYPDASLNMLASAWASRTEALEQGVKDNPYEIIRWIALTKFKEIAAQHTETIGGQTVSELLEEHGEVAYELVRNYSIQTSMDAFLKYLTIQAERGFYDSEFTPGKTEVEYDGKTYELEWLPKGSPVFFSMGVDTGCCMTLDGASKDCIWEAMTNPNYGGMTVKIGGKVRAQSVAYLGNDESENNAKTLVLDNIEVNAGTDEEVIREVYKIGLQRLLDEGRINPAIRNVNLGEGYSDVDFADLEVARPLPHPPGVYSDAGLQRRLFTRTRG